MGLTVLRVEVGNPADPLRMESLEFLLGAFSLEALGLALDPLRRELKPIPMVLGGWRTTPVDS